MSSLAVEYFGKKFGDDASAAFIQLVRETGEIEFVMEKKNAEHAKLEITESVALSHFLAKKYNLDLDASIPALIS